MKITTKTDTHTHAILPSKYLKPSPHSDPLRKPNSRLNRSRPHTPLLLWKLEDVSPKDDIDLPNKSTRKPRRSRDAVVSARKLAAGLWRLQLQLPENQTGVPFLAHHTTKTNSCPAIDLTKSSHSVSAPRNGFFCKLEPSLHFSNSAMEGATKWDPASWKASDEVKRVYGQSKHLDQQVATVSAVSALEVELKQAQTRIHELETEQRSSKKKLEHFLKKLSDERAVWRSREHEKIRAIIDDIKADLNRERKNRQRMEIVNSKLVKELADAKSSAKRFLQEYEKERKARELIEVVCDELAKEIGEDKSEVEEIKRDSLTLREEVEDERKMLQIAEVWREERVQMKLVDAKVTLEEKYTQMNNLVADMEAFLRSKGATLNMEEMKKAELLRQAVASLSIQDIKEFTYEPPNADDIFSVFDDVNFGDHNEREIEPFVAFSPASRASKVRTVSLEVNMLNKDSIQRHSRAYLSQNGDIEDDESGWETVSHPEDQGSSYSPDGSDPSVNKIYRDSNVSGSGTEWEEKAGDETPISEISEACSVITSQSKKASSISRIWRSRPSNVENYKIISVDGMNGRLSNGRLSSGAITSPDHGSGQDGLGPPDLVEQWSSPDAGNPHITRGMKGCIEWPRGTQKNSLKAKLLEARIESQKIQLRHVLKQKI